MSIVLTAAAASWRTPIVWSCEQRLMDRIPIAQQILVLRIMDVTGALEARATVAATAACLLLWAAAAGYLPHYRWLEMGLVF